VLQATATTPQGGSAKDLHVTQVSSTHLGTYVWFTPTRSVLSLTPGSVVLIFVPYRHPVPVEPSFRVPLMCVPLNRRGCVRAATRTPSRAGSARHILYALTGRMTPQKTSASPGSMPALTAVQGPVCFSTG
ncbi:MAG: hypothetical protein QXO44_02675, partial [Thermoplasmatales archaeon]